jgi:3-hydroxybutyryl-CoA dehydrogenase
MSEKLEDYTLSKSVQKQGDVVKAGLVGCGSMGQEIAILISKSGIELTFVEISEYRIERAIKKMEQQIDVAISHWGMTSGDKRAIMSRIKGTTNYENLSDCTIVIEAINTKKWVPNQPTRKDVFQKIERVVTDDCLIVSNASTIVISDLSSELRKPCRAIGVHFISPVLTTKIIEVNRCINTTDDAIKKIRRFTRMIGKDIIKVYGSPGNISTRLIVPMINEACELLMEGVSTVAEIDKTMKVGYGMLRGPFSLADRIGLDKLTKWMEGLYNEYGDTRYKTSPLIRRMVRAGMLGRKSNEGFYYYKDGNKIEKNGSVFQLGHEQKLF